MLRNCKVGRCSVQCFIEQAQTLVSSCSLGSRNRDKHELVAWPNYEVFDAGVRKARTPRGFGPGGFSEDRA